MQVSLKPVVFHPVPVVRPVAKVKRARANNTAEAAAAVTAPPVDDERGSRSSRRRAKPKVHEEAGAAPHDPAMPLAQTLALLHLDRAFRDGGGHASS